MLPTLLTDAVPHLTPAFRAAHARLWVPEHFARLAERLADWHATGVPAGPPPPHFDAELLPDFAAAFTPFRDVLDTGDPVRVAGAVETAGCANLLVLLGQRRTPATLTGPDGIPPTTAELLAAASAKHGVREALTVAARALAKHAGRSGDGFWGEPRGPVAGQNAAADAVVRTILAGRTWWNVFGHYAHDIVFEARLPTGHGARWADGGATFVGFLEPFDIAKCRSLPAGGRDRLSECRPHTPAEAVGVG